jgi:hypothetical protein
MPIGRRTITRVAKIKEILTHCPARESNSLKLRPVLESKTIKTKAIFAIEERKTGGKFIIFCPVGVFIRLAIIPIKISKKISEIFIFCEK